MAVLRRASFVLSVALCCGVVASAGPLTELGKGHLAVTFTWLPNLSMTDEYLAVDWPIGPGNPSADSGDGRRPNLAVDVTAGMAKDWGFQFRFFSPESDTVQPELGPPQRFSFRTRQVNVLRKVGPDLAAYVGWFQGEFGFSAPLANLSTTPRRVFQVGLTGTRRLSRTVALQATAGVGNRMFDTQFGAVVRLAKRLDFDLTYRYTRVEGLQDWTFGTNYVDDLKAKGLGFGLTWHF